MEKITVSLDLKDYNELLDIIEKTRLGSVPVWGRNTAHDDYGGYDYLCLYSKDEAIKELIKFNGRLNENINELQDKEIAELGCSKSERIILKNVKKMSIWQFIKWRRDG